MPMPYTNFPNVNPQIPRDRPRPSTGTTPRFRPDGPRPRPSIPTSPGNTTAPRGPDGPRPRPNNPNRRYGPRKTRPTGPWPGRRTMNG